MAHIRRGDWGLIKRLRGEIPTLIETVQQVFALALPAIAQLVLQSLVFLTDRAMLGHYNTDALASLRISSPLIWCIYGTLSAFSVGSIAVVGRAIGQGDRALAGAAARSSLLLAIAVGSAASGLSWLSVNGLLALFPEASAEVLTASRTYMQIILPAMPLQLISIVAAAVLQAAGNTQTPFLVAAIANAVNILLNYIFIFGHYGAPELGVQGAAIGSVSAMSVNAIALCIFLLRPGGVLTIRGLGGELPALLKVWRVCAPALSERLFRSVGYIGFTVLIAALGRVAMATHEAIMGSEEISYQVADGFGVATAALVAQQLGAARPQQAAAIAKISAFLAVGVLSCASLMFVLIPDWLIRAFSPDPAILSVGVPCFYVAAIAQPFMAITIVMEQVLRGAGDTRMAFYVSLMGWFVVRLCATYFFALWLDLGLLGVWLGSTCDWIVRSLILLLIFYRNRWQQISV